MMRFLATVLKIIMPIVVVAAGVVVARHFMNTAEKPERRSTPPRLQVVEVLQVKPEDFQVIISSRGTVSPRTQSTLVSEVTGRIEKVSPNFREGSFFDKDEVLVNIDRRDYEHNLTIVKAELAQAELALSENQAQSQQARREWDRLGLKGKPSDLTLRQPQLKSSQAAVEAARARVRQAKTDLGRTSIEAPYDGRILDKQVDIGQFVPRGAVLASIYAVDYVEVRLPVTEQQAAFLTLPEAYQDETISAQGPDVDLLVNSAGREWQWKGRIVRMEGAIDIKSRQQFAIVQVDKPYAKHDDGRPPLKVGQFVTAQVKGNVIEEAIVLPREIVRGNDEIIVIKDDNTVEKRKLDIIWRDDRNVVVSKGLQTGERVSRTLLSFATDGMKVKLQGEAGKLGKSAEKAAEKQGDKTGAMSKTAERNE